MRYFITLLFFFTLHLSCAQTGTQTIETMQYDGETRSYIVYVPQSYTGQSKVPLVLNLHGYGSSMSHQISYGEFRDIADTANFIMVVPNGLLDVNNLRTWNYFQQNGPDDIGFLSVLIDELSAQYEINENRVYATGMSNGGFMSVFLGCNLSNKVTAIASVTGTMLNIHVNTCLPNKPTPAMFIHGTEDTLVPYSGNATFASVNYVVGHWVSQVGAYTSPQIFYMPNIVLSDSSTVERHLYSGGSNGATIEHFKIVKGGHSWPGASTDIDKTNYDIDASKEIWRFFSQYDRQTLLKISDNNQNHEVNIVPNPNSGNFTIHTSHNIDEVEIYSIEGKKIKSSSNYAVNNHEINVESGTYFVKMLINNKWKHSKIVVQ
ncbi:hypothetical protein CW751_00875 [Brumimicrobium salinarum]|uniref:Uncharacterized protein n=1 Tax=Brumimicrobium salinarum TaxID=2058658 RepID=A0A2I0R5R4_9FLAO|nr:T9SS type A sorting domain-containing protein [Brumimicrobium salinarum]PKR81921.1 hypothetical protein CW751_00875 [Brumimicrobium salinarum]